MKRLAQPRESDPREQLALERLRTARLAQELDGMLNSTSWRLTAPMRAFVSLLKGKRGDAEVPAIEAARVAPQILPELLARELPTIGGDMSLRLIDGLPFLSGLFSDEVIRSFVGERTSREEWDFGSDDKTGGTIALISGPSLARELAFEERVIRLGSSEQGPYFADSKPDFLLIDTDFQDLCTHWAGMLQEPGNLHLKSLVAECRNKRIPVVLWLRVEPQAYNQVRHLLGAADYVYAIDEQVLELAKSDYEPSRTAVLGPRVQTHLYNPARTPLLNVMRGRIGFAIMRDGLVDILTAGEEDLQSLGCARWLVESYWDLESAAADTPVASPHILAGVLSEADKLIFMRLLIAEEFAPSPTRPRWRLQRDMLRAIASGMLIVVHEDALKCWPLGELAPFAKSAEEARSLAEDALGSAWWRRRAIDEVTAKFGWKAALGRIRAAVALASSATDPLVSCILVTKRPENFRQALSNFEHQTYSNRELLVVLHSSESGSWPELGDLGSAVTVMVASPSQSLGDCLNMAIARAGGRFWAKMDDDDYYAPEYLRRLICLLRQTDAELTGMPKVFTLFESDLSLFWDPERLDLAFALHEKGWQRGEICGATLAGTVDLATRVRFPSSRRQGADSLFLDSCEQQGARMVVGDGFGYVCHRSARRKDHTWGGDEDVVRARGYVVRDRMLPISEVNQ